MARLSNVMPAIEKIDGVSRAWHELEFVSSGWQRVIVVEVRADVGQIPTDLLDAVLDAAGPALTPGAGERSDRIRVVPASR